MAETGTTATEAAPALGGAASSTTPAAVTPAPDAQLTLLGGATGATGTTPNGATGSVGDKGPTATVTTEAAKPAGASGTVEAAKPVGLPETFEFKLPEGVDAKVAPTAELKALAKSLGLDAEKAQLLGDGLFKSPMFKALADLNAEIIERAALQKAWVEQVKTDKDIGGDKFKASIDLANATLSRFPSGKEAAEFLRTSGAGNNPHIVKLFVEIGKSISEDTSAGANGTPQNGAATSAEAALRLMYPTMFQKEQ